MLRLLPLCLLVTSCGLLKLPVNVVKGVGSATVGVTKKATSATKDLFTKDEKKEEAPESETPEDTVANENYDTLPQPEEAYTPAPVRQSVYIPDSPYPTTPPPESTAPTPETITPPPSTGSSLPKDYKLPELPPIDVPDN